MLTRVELIRKHREFFEAKGYVQTAPYFLVPDNNFPQNPAVFTPAGVHPLIPYFSDQQQPESNKLYNVQRSFRPGDMREIGDSYHHSFFEMMGCFEFNNPPKQEFLSDMLEFLVKALDIPIEKLGFTAFGGNSSAAIDQEAIDAVVALGISKKHVALSEDFFIGPIYLDGPSGPNNEFHFWRSEEAVPETLDPDNRHWLEIGGYASVEYLNERDERGQYKKVENRKIDFGFGLERILATANHLFDNYLTDVFLPAIQSIEHLSDKKYGAIEAETRAMRIIADHIRAAVFIGSEGITPDDMRGEYVERRVRREPTTSQFDKYIGREYLLRLLVRRAVRQGDLIGIRNFAREIGVAVLSSYSDARDLHESSYDIIGMIEEEESKFLNTLYAGLDYLKSHSGGTTVLPGDVARRLFDNYGFPVEIIEEEASRLGLGFDRRNFELEFNKYIG